MSAERIMKVLANCDQGLSAGQKSQARANIGAQGALTAGDNVSIVNDTISAVDTTYTAGTNVSISDQNVISATDTTYSVFDTTTDGLVPKSGANTDKFLKGDGTWDSPLTSVTATAPLAGTGTSSDPLVLRISHGLSLVQPAGGVTSLQVTYPVPAPASGDNGKYLKTDSLGNFSWDTPSDIPDPTGYTNAFLYTQDGTSVSWRRPTFGNIIDVAKTVTATDIANGYVDIPFYWVDADKMIPVTGCFMFLNLWDASLDRGSTSISISSYVDKIKGSICTATADWYSSDNSHGSDPEGLFFENISGADLARIGGYPRLATPVRKIGAAPNVLTTMRGPSFRVVFATGQYQVQDGDKIALDGSIMATYW